MPLVAGKSHLIDLAAPETTNRHRHWKVPFHNVLNYPLASVRVKYASFARSRGNYDLIRNACTGCRRKNHLADACNNSIRCPSGSATIARRPHSESFGLATTPSG
jgi:hypothetical protein